MPLQMINRLTVAMVGSWGIRTQIVLWPEAASGSTNAIAGMLAWELASESASDPGIVGIAMAGDLKCVDSNTADVAVARLMQHAHARIV